MKILLKRGVEAEFVLKTGKKKAELSAEKR